METKDITATTEELRERAANKGAIMVLSGETLTLGFKDGSGLEKWQKTYGGMWKVVEVTPTTT
ncbi:MAG: hypothetical protein M3P49_14300 [Actinomycetota bacterium]|nr:hypothetical protein [Actinomycetota bacterium]